MRSFLKKEILVVVLSYLVHASVYASQPSLWAQLNTTGTVIDLFINLMSAICASMANTAFRLKSTEFEVTQVFKELAYGVGVGFTAGVITYAATEAAATNKFLQLAMVTIAGWGGAKVIESYYSKYFGEKPEKQ